MELRALRAQMNPHFTFNTMNSIQHFIKKNKSEDALKYISKFARLIRMILDHSSEARITIEKDLEALRLYLDIESLRFDQQFSYEIHIDETIDESYDKIPPMLIQPYVENAIWHGLTNKVGGGKVLIDLKEQDDQLTCVIEDDGIGRKQAAELKPTNPTHKSYGMMITEERLKLLNITNDQSMHLHIEDLLDGSNESSGTRVTLTIPIN